MEVGTGTDNKKEFSKTFFNKINVNKKAVRSQGNRAMPQLFFSV